MAPPRKTKQLKDEDDLKFDRAKGDHQRKQNLLDVFNKVTCFLVIVVPILALLALLIVMTHYAIIGDWNSFNSLGGSVIKYFVALIFGYVVKGLAPYKEN